jgi:WD40 repeat protein
MVNRSRKNNKLKGGKPLFVGKFCREISTLPGHTKAVTSVAFHPSSYLLATCSTDRTAKLWRFDPDGSNPVCTDTANGHTDNVLSVAFNPRGNLLATGSSDSTAKLWSFNEDGSNPVCTGNTTKPPIYYIKGLHSDGEYVQQLDSVYSVVFHPSGNLLATASESIAKLWSFDPDGSNLVTTGWANWFGKYFTSVAFHPTSNLLATGSADNTAKLWRFNPHGKHLDLARTDTANVNGHTNSVISVAFHPSHNLLVTGSSDNTAKLWSFHPDGSNLKCISTLTGHTDSVTSVAFHPDGYFLATGSGDNTAKIWRFNPDGSNPRCIETLTGHTGGVNSVAFHPNGNLLATGSIDKTAKLWDCSKLTTEYRQRLALTHGRLATQLIGELTENPQLRGTWSKSTMRSVLNQSIGNVLEINTSASKANPDSMKAQKYLEFLPRESAHQGLPTGIVEDSHSQSVVEAARVTGFCAVDDMSCISIFESIPWSRLNSIPGGCAQASELLEKLVRLESLLQSSSSTEIDSKLRLTTLWIKKLRNKIDQCKP